MSIVCVVPSVRPDHLIQFKAAWKRLFDYHQVQLLVVHDGEHQRLELNGVDLGEAADHVPSNLEWLFPKFTDSCRNIGFYYAAEQLQFSEILSLDDDTRPVEGRDSIAEHLSVLRTRVPLSWMNTGNAEPFYRGVPYSIRNEAVVHLSHATWKKIPDLDSATQLMLTGRIDPDPSYYVGSIPRHVLFPLCGMAVMFTREALPYCMYAPMGKSTPFNRFGDIWAGISIKREFDRRDWAIYTGASQVVHDRASNVFRNLEQEAAGLEMNERWWAEGDSIHPYFADYARRRQVYAEATSKLLGDSK